MPTPRTWTETSTTPDGVRTERDHVGPQRPMARWVVVLHGIDDIPGEPDIVHIRAVHADNADMAIGAALEWADFAGPRVLAYAIPDGGNVGAIIDPTKVLNLPGAQGWGF